MDTSIAGTALTVGAVASFVTEWTRRQPWFPESKSLTRLFVAVLCALLYACVTVVTGGPLGWETLLTAFMSYVAAVATHDHVL